MLYSFGKFLFKIIFRVFFRYQVTGANNVPDKGPVIVCANHMSYWDPPLVGVSLKRQVHFMAKEELFRIPLLGSALRGIGTFPVKRGTADPSAIRQAARLLRDGRVMGIFPEGTRVRPGTTGKHYHGAALLASWTKAPVVPLGIQGPYRFFKPVIVRIGTPIDFGAEVTSGDRDSDLEAMTQRIMAGIYALIGK